MERYDVVIIGAGIAGASLAWALAGRRRVLLLERESQPGYHSTGRSAATLNRSYGNDTIRALTAASAPFYLEPPAGFCEVPLTAPRGVLVVAREDERDMLEAEIERSLRFVPTITRLDRAACLARVPALRADYVAAGMLDPELLELDVAAILAGFLKGARAQGAVLHRNAEVLGLGAEGDGWRIELRQGVVHGGVVVNAAGAWADTLAGLAGIGGLGIVPKRRTAIVVQAPLGSEAGRWPLVDHVAETWYVKPDAGRLFCSPADQTPTEPSDVQPDELDVAICVDRVQTALDIEIRRIESKWAGLRSFAPDKTPVAGFDPRAPGFFWLAGQGGYGIQTAPAMAAFATARIMGEDLPAWLAATGLAPAALDPARLVAA